MKKLIVFFVILLSFSGCTKPNADISLDTDVSEMLTSTQNIDPSVTSINETIINPSKLGDKSSYSSYNLLLSDKESLLDSDIQNIVWKNNDTILITSKEKSNNNLVFCEVSFVNNTAKLVNNVVVNTKNKGIVENFNTGFSIKDPSSASYTILNKNYSVTKQNAVSLSDLKENPTNFIYSSDFSTIAYQTTTSYAGGYSTVSVHLYDIKSLDTSVVTTFSLNTNENKLLLVGFSTDDENIIYMKKPTDSSKESVGGIINIERKGIFEYPLEVAGEPDNIQLAITSTVPNSDSFVWLTNTSNFKSITDYQTNAILDLNTSSVFDLKLKEKFCHKEDLELKNSGLIPILDTTTANFICFYNDGSSYSMFMYDIHSGDIETVYTEYGSDLSGNYSLSPDGTKLAALVPSGHSQKYTLNLITINKDDLS